MAGEKQKRLTREDVIRLIKENGGTAEGLDLSEKIFEGGIDLSDLDLHRIILKGAILAGADLEDARLECAHLEEADLSGANLKGADLVFTHLERATLLDADLKSAHLEYTHLEGANLRGAHLEGAILSLAYLKKTILSTAHLEGVYLRAAEVYEAHLEDVEWGNYKIGEETRKDFYTAESIYRRLKQWYTNAGVYDIAGEFFYREMEAKRKSMKWWPQPWHRAWVEFVSFICGYGERPYRVILWAASVVLGLALIYFAIGSTWEWWAFWNSLYFSAVSFTALGYGTWAYTPPEAWVQGVGAAESFIGVFTIALFLITFTRKMRR